MIYEEVWFEPGEGGATQVCSGEEDLGPVTGKKVRGSEEMEPEVGEEGIGSFFVPSIELGRFVELDVGFAGVRKGSVGCGSRGGTSVGDGVLQMLVLSGELL
jgi:hypothetical protein